MKLSVIVPVYNVEDYVEECLESLARQTCRDMEVLIIDDGSKDGSSAICKRYAESYERFSYVHKENGGLMSAWVKGVTLATGDYIGFVDSDDCVDPSMYEQMLSCAEEKNADIVMCDHRCVFPDKIVPVGPKKELNAYYAEEEMGFIKEHAFSSLFSFNISNERWNKIYRRTLLLENLVYCKDLSRFHEAKYITPACLFSAKSFAYVAKPFYDLRVRAGSNSSVVKPDLVKWTEHLYATQKQMLADKKQEAYLPCLEKSKIDYFRIVFNRCSRAEFKGRLALAKELLTQENIKLIRKYKKECIRQGGKTGKLLYYTMASGSSVLVATGMWLLRLR